MVVVASLGIRQARGCLLARLCQERRPPPPGPHRYPTPGGPSWQRRASTALCTAGKSLTNIRKNSSHSLLQAKIRYTSYPYYSLKWSLPTAQCNDKRSSTTTTTYRTRLSYPLPICLGQLHSPIISLQTITLRHLPTPRLFPTLLSLSHKYVSVSNQTHIPIRLVPFPPSPLRRLPACVARAVALLTILAGSLSVLAASLDGILLILPSSLSFMIPYGTYACLTVCLEVTLSISG